MTAARSVEPQFIRHAATRPAREVFHSFSQGHVPDVPRAGGRRAHHPRRQGLPAQAVPARTARSEALISGDADWFLRSLDLHQGRARCRSSSRRTVEDGCPKDCGLCPDHEQHSCLPIIEITNHCNLECPICIVQNRNNYHMTRGGVRRDRSTG